MLHDKWVKMFQTEKHQVLVRAKKRNPETTEVRICTMINGQTYNEDLYSGGDHEAAQKIFDGMDRVGAKEWLENTLEHHKHGTLDSNHSGFGDQPTAEAEAEEAKAETEGNENGAPEGEQVESSPEPGASEEGVAEGDGEVEPVAETEKTEE